MVRMRRASGGREEALLKKAEALRRSSKPLLPERTRECPPEPFDRLGAAFEAVREYKDDAARLDRMRRWGEPFARAYAGFLRFYLEPDLPPLLPARVGGAQVTFAPLARAPSEFQIAVQQFDDPRKLLLGYLGLARKGFYFYALPDRLLCAGRDPTPPAEFLRKQDEDLPYRFERGGVAGAFDCPHLAQEEPIPWLGVEWVPAQRTFRICQKCAKEDAQLLGALAAGLAQPRAERAFDVQADLNVDCRGGPDCIHHALPGVSRGLRRRYTLGRVADKEFLQEYVREVSPYVERRGGALLVAAGVCYGRDRAAFIDALHANKVERAALERVLPSLDSPFTLADPTASQALERLWHDHAEAIVAAIEPDPAEARRLAAEARANPGRVSDLLRRAAQRADERATLSALPTYAALGPEAAFADAIARAFRTGGAEAAERRVEQSLPHEGKARSLAWGFLLAVGREGSHRWQFSDTEQKFGASLVEPARRLLEGPPAEYDRALGQLLTTAGVAEAAR
jgi:hypothetical protein